jgi:hypothetical protein
MDNAVQPMKWAAVFASNVALMTVALSPACAGLKTLMRLNLGLTPQALRLRLLRRLSIQPRSQAKHFQAGSELRRSQYG